MHTPRTAAALALAAALSATVAEARSLSASLTYPERIALPESAEVVVELRARAGFLVAERRFATEGRQVPFDVTFFDLPEMRLDLRAAVWDGGQPIRMTDTVEVAAGAADVVLPPLRLAPYRAMGFSSRLDCGEVQVELGFAGDLALLRIGDRVVELMPEPAASGARFVAPGDDGTWVWSRGDRALVSLAGEELPECTAALPEGLLPFVAIGHEPAWRLDLDTATLRLTTDMGATVIEAPLPEAAQDGGTIRFADAERGLEAVLEPDICRDIATGMPYPYAVGVQHGEAAFAGCGGDPLALTRGITWHLQEIAGTPVADDRLTIYLTAEEVGGHGPCNYYFGDVALSGEGLRLGPMAVTRRMCDAPRMALERALLDTLGTVTRFDVTDDGRLLLLAGDTPVIAARR